MPLLIAALLPAIPHIITGIETLFGHGNGSSKKQAAIGLIADAANGFAAAAGLPGANSALMTFIEKEIENVVTYMNDSGTFTHGATK